MIICHCLSLMRYITDMNLPFQSVKLFPIEFPRSLNLIIIMKIEIFQIILLSDIPDVKFICPVKIFQQVVMFYKRVYP